MNGYKKVPIIIGSEAHYLAENERIVPELSHSWKCYVKIAPQLVKSVQFKLHESFENPYITVLQAPFEILEQGWGEFTIQIKILLFNDEKITVNHYIRLHGPSYPVITERYDTLVYKGKPFKIDEEYDFIFEGEEEEYKRIDEAINYMLDLFDNLN